MTAPSSAAEATAEAPRSPRAQLDTELRAVLAAVEEAGPLPFGVDQPEGPKVYARSRRSRLLEVLQDEFPRVRAVLGDIEFEQACLRFLSRHPPSSPALRDLGHRFPCFLAETGAPTLAVEFARLELAHAHVFDAPAHPAAGRDALARLPLEDWPAMTLSLRAVQVVRATHRLDRFDPTRPEAGAPEADCQLLLFRREHRIFVRAVEPDEAEALDAAARGLAFGVIADAVATHQDSLEAAAHRSLEIIAGWLDDGIVRSLALTEGDPSK